MKVLKYIPRIFQKYYLNYEHYYYILMKIKRFNDITPTEKINGTRLFIFIHSITMF
jgi:hypothetical protein